MDLLEERDLIKSQMREALSTIRQNGLKMCQSEMNYRIAKAKAIIKLRGEGYPTTLIPDVVKGIEEIALLDYERNCDEVVYKSNVEALNEKKIEFKSIEGDIEREWNNARNY